MLANGSIGVGASLEERCDIVMEEQVAAVAEAGLLVGPLDQQIAGLAVASNGGMAVASQSLLVRGARPAIPALALGDWPSHFSIEAWRPTC